MGIGSLEFFFFQAEDGIRDWSVTGVQTCALPIFGGRANDGWPKPIWKRSPPWRQIGRGSCRGKGEVSGGGRVFKKKKGKSSRVDEGSGGEDGERQVCRAGGALETGEGGWT